MPEILYSDDQLVAVVKPAKQLSVPGKGPDKQDCLWHRVQQQFPTARIVHRLDYATSGVMVLALTADSHRALSLQFQHRQTGKRYQAIVAGQLAQSEGTVELPLRCDWERRPLQMVCYEQGKPAQTHWRRLEAVDGNSRVELLPITGRSHQLRVHMLSLGHPMLGDEFYAPEPIRKQSERLLLHAEMLSVQHPISGEPLRFEKPCPF
ncbi:RNA pseudouridine synthase [Marinobacterium sp. CAU 1594]|nr:RNA pseudouridine synthase [Marinobacterium arenosum]